MADRGRRRRQVGAFVEASMKCSWNIPAECHKTDGIYAVITIRFVRIYYVQIEFFRRVT